jgi:adenosine deaminase
LGHGISSVGDDQLVEHLAEVGMPVEVCPSSNVALGVVESLDEHPFDALYRAGVAVSVNSDDPPFFDTTLSEEYERLSSTFGYSQLDLAGLALRPLDQAFLGVEQHRDLEAEMRAGMEELGLQYDLVVERSVPKSIR